MTLCACGGNAIEKQRTSEEMNSRKKKLAAYATHEKKLPAKLIRFKFYFSHFALQQTEQIVEFGQHTKAKL